MNTPPVGPNRHKADDNSLLKDAFLLALEVMLGPKHPDGKIAGKLVRGEPLDAPERSHVWAECRNLPGLTDAHRQAIAKLED